MVVTGEKDPGITGLHSERLKERALRTIKALRKEGQPTAPVKEQPNSAFSRPPHSRWRRSASHAAPHSPALPLLSSDWRVRGASQSARPLPLRGRCRGLAQLEAAVGGGMSRLVPCLRSRLLLCECRAVSRGLLRVSLAAGPCRGTAGCGAASDVSMEELLSRSVPPLPPYETKEKAPPPAELRGAEFVRYYRGLPAGPPRAELLTRLARDFGVDHGRVAEFSAKVLQAREQQRELGALLQAEDRLRYYLNPRYRGLFQHLGRLEGGLRFLVELRGDLVEGLASKAVDGPHVKVRAGAQEAVRARGGVCGRAVSRERGSLPCVCDGMALTQRDRHRAAEGVAARLSEARRRSDV